MAPSLRRATALPGRPTRCDCNIPDTDFPILLRTLGEGWTDTRIHGYTNQAGCLALASHVRTTVPVRRHTCTDATHMQTNLETGQARCFSFHVQCSYKPIRRRTHYPAPATMPAKPGAAKSHVPSSRNANASFVRLYPSLLRYMYIKANKASARLPLSRNVSGKSKRSNTCPACMHRVASHTSR